MNQISLILIDHFVYLDYIYLIKELNNLSFNYIYYSILYVLIFW